MHYKSDLCDEDRLTITRGTNEHSSSRHSLRIQDAV
jgi:hypothetical protein